MILLENVLADFASTLETLSKEDRALIAIDTHAEELENIYYDDCRAAAISLLLAQLAKRDQSIDYVCGSINLAKNLCLLTTYEAHALTWYTKLIYEQSKQGS